MVLVALRDAWVTSSARLPGVNQKDLLDGERKAHCPCISLKVL